jgi:hypothetical protein
MKTHQNNAKRYSASGYNATGYRPDRVCDGVKKKSQQMMQREHASPLPSLSASTGTSKRRLRESSKRSFGEVWSSSGSLRKDANSTYESIAMSVVWL